MFFVVPSLYGATGFGTAGAGHAVKQILTQSRASMQLTADNDRWVERLRKGRQLQVMGGGQRARRRRRRRRRRRGRLDSQMIKAILQ